jgi:hypothetical protein
MSNKIELLNSFKDHEVLNAFKLALINTNVDQGEPNSSDFFYENLGKNFVNLLRHKSDSSDDGFNGKFGDMNIQSENSIEPSVVSDFGDIIPVDIEVTANNCRKHQKWTIGEQKKLMALLGSRCPIELIEKDWNDISYKLNRTKTSIFYKAKELYKKPPNLNKKRKVTENPLSSFNDDISQFSGAKNEREFNTMTIPSEPDITLDDTSKETKPDCLFVSRKKAIESVLDEMPNK